MIKDDPYAWWGGDCRDPLSEHFYGSLTPLWRGLLQPQLNWASMAQIEDDACACWKVQLLGVCLGGLKPADPYDFTLPFGGHCCSGLGDVLT